MDRGGLIRKLVIVLMSCALLFLFMTGLLFSPAPTQAKTLYVASAGTASVQVTPTVDTTVTVLAKDQLKLQVDALQHDPGNWFWNNAATVVSILLSTIIIVGGAFIGFFRWRKDLRIEQDKRSEERFQSVIEDLGKQDIPTKIGAAIMLRTFLRPGYEQFYSQIFELATAHLQLQEITGANISEPIILLRRLLTIVFRESFPPARDWLKKQNVSSNFHLLDATNIRFIKADLSGADLKNVWMPGSYMVEANLRSADLSYANLRGADLSKAILNTTTFAHANLTHANLSEAILERAELPDAILDDTNLIKTNLAKANLTRATLIRADLTEAVLEQAKLPHSFLEGANLTKANLVGADLTGVALVGQANLTEANLTGAILVGADLTSADLTGAILSATNPDAAQSLVGTKMLGVTGLSQTQHNACIAKGAIF
jgi:uncharacterized protein YjbI with pentapeptide repeats